MSKQRLPLSWWVLPEGDGLSIERSVFRAAYSGVHVLFGPNNSGKSRILRALCNAPAAIEITWDTIVQHNSDNLIQVARELARRFAAPPLTFDARRQNFSLTLSAESRQALEQFRTHLGSRIDALVTQIEGALPSLKEKVLVPQPALYVRAHRYLSTTAPISNNDGNADKPEEMVQALSRWQNNQDIKLRDRFERIQTAFLRISGVAFALRQSDKWSVHITENETRVERPLNKCGDGLRDLLGLILRVEEHPDCGIFLDEPGVRLHPRAQRALFQYLFEAAAHRPVWLATHDGVFIGSADVAERYAISREQGITTARRVTSPKEARSAFSELGWNPRDALLCDTILFCEGPSDRAVFSQLLEEPGHPVFQGVEVVQLGGDRIWGRDTARLKSVVEAVRAVASHARFVALLDQGGHPQPECDRVARVLDTHGIETFWLRDGELETFWMNDPEFCSRLCGAMARSARVEFQENEIRTMIESVIAKSSTKSSDTLKQIFDHLSLPFSKREIADVAVELMTQGQGERPRAQLIQDLTRALKGAK